MTDRFDFEQQLMKCWHVTDDIGTIISFIEDSKIDPKTADTLLNMLIGMQALYNHKFSDLLDTFSLLIKQGAFPRPKFDETHFYQKE